MAMPEITNKPSATAFSISLGSAKPKAAPSTRSSVQPFGLRGKKRSHDDSEDDDYDSFSQDAQLVTGFDAGRGGAISLDGNERYEGPLVIPALKNRDWKEESLKRRNKTAVYLPPEAHKKQQAEGDSTERVGGEIGDDVDKSKYGLQILKKEEQKGKDIFMKEGVGNSKVVSNADSSNLEERTKTEDELALEALLAGENGVARRSDLVLPMTSGDANWRDAVNVAFTEEEAYRMDIASRPDAPSLEDYEAVPVEEFGAALLRGMGWKEGQELGRRGERETKIKAVEKRPAFLGLGAKSNNVMEELGSWGKGAAKGKRSPWMDKAYTPVVLKNKTTGEIVEVSSMLDKRSEKEGTSSDKDSDYRRKERSPQREYRSDRDSEGKRRSHKSGDGRYYEKRSNGRSRSYERNRERDRDRGVGDRDTYRERERERDYDRDWSEYRQRNKVRDDRRDKERYRRRERSRERGTRK